MLPLCFILKNVRLHIDSIEIENNWVNLGKNFSIPTVSDNMFKNLAYGVGECKITCSQETKDKLMHTISETKANIIWVNVDTMNEM